MKWILVIVVVLTTLTACDKLGYAPVTPTVQHVMPTPIDGWATHNGTGINLKIKVPDGWDTYNTESGIVLSEHMGTAETGGVLEGILVYVFVPETVDFDLPDANQHNLAWSMLKEVVHDDDYVGNALASEPQAFEWDGNEAAYYLLNNRDGTLTMLLAVELSTSHRMVVCHISTLEEHADRIRSFLPQVLGTLTIDGLQMDDAALYNLPNPLNFPVETSTSS
jgi:hypothetical protein